MRFLIVAAIGVLLAGPLTAGVIPINSTVFVPIKPDALGYVRASIVPEGVPVQLVADPDKAEYTLVGGFEEDSDGVGGRGWLELISSTGTVVWADSAVGRTGGNISRSRTLVKRLKKAILKR
ncbi:MAG: hypothetical protein F4Y47_13885 [Acidobacteriia bacterium]|nr:hypothetical protein [Terriglobia bacterium]MYG03920.1 hypothetical protein [Terriglobia bacterium]MYK09890.1 hypothetical protein [Terriglobia bacterium]